MNIYDALVDILTEMSSFVQNRDGQYWVVNPVDPEENFADRWSGKPELQRDFFSWLAKAQRDFFAIAQRAGMLHESIPLMKSMIGERPIENATQALGFNNPAPYTPWITSVVPPLGSTAHALSLSMTEQLVYRVRVKGSVHLGKGKRQLWELFDRPVKKNVWLRFSATTNAPKPYEVRWQVVNTGVEAMRANGLRGDFYDSAKGMQEVRWETMLYRGTHWVEAFTIKRGICVERSGKQLVKIK